MRRTLATAALALALTPLLTAGTASADSFEVLPSEPTTNADVFSVVATEAPTADTFEVVSGEPMALPSADVPNPLGSILNTGVHLYLYERAAIPSAG